MYSYVRSQSTTKCLVGKLEPAILFPRAAGTISERRSRNRDNVICTWCATPRRTTRDAWSRSAWRATWGKYYGAVATGTPTAHTSRHRCHQATCQAACHTMCWNVRDLAYLWPACTRQPRTGCWGYCTTHGLIARRVCGNSPSPLCAALRCLCRRVSGPRSSCCCRLAGERSSETLPSRCSSKCKFILQCKTDLTYDLEINPMILRNSLRPFLLRHPI